MIRTNLSTRPFYNERAVHFWLLVMALLIVAATIFNVTRVLRYSRSTRVTLKIVAATIRSAMTSSQKWTARSL